MFPCAIRRTRKGVLLRVDAKAEGDEVVIGGWLPARDVKGDLNKWESKWFSVDLTRDNAPWAFENNKLFTKVAALELLATTVGIHVFGDGILGEGYCDGTVEFAGHTDSAVSAHVVSRGLSTTFPLCVVAMELSALLESRKARLDLHWIPRDVNEEADALTNKEFVGFDPGKRINIDLKKIPWLVVSKYMDLGLAYYAEIKGKKEEAKRERLQKKRPASMKGKFLASAGGRKKALREREPWG